jgi:hypothetical protein
VCEKFNEFQDSHELMTSIEMEEVWIASNLENEREGRDVNLGVEGSKSYGHVMKIIERL